MKCPQCGVEQANDAQTCSFCGRVLKGDPGTGFALPGAGDASRGQQVGKIILPEGVSPNAPAPGAAGLPADPSAPASGRAAGPGAPAGPRGLGPGGFGFPSPPPAGPPTGSHPTPTPGQKKAEGAASEPEFEVYQPPKTDIKKLILPGIALLAAGGYLLYTKAMEAPPPPPPPAPAVAVVKPPDPAVESCKKGLVGQGFLAVEADAFCEDTPETRARVKEVLQARAATMNTIGGDFVTDIQALPVRGETTPAGLVRVYLYAVFTDTQNRQCALGAGNVEVVFEPAAAVPLKPPPLTVERFRREALAGRDRPTLHAYLGAADFDPAVLAGQSLLVTIRFDNGRLENQAAITF